MQVSAKCIMASSLSSPIQQYFTPGGGPLPGGLYEIDRNGPLAELKTSGGKMGKYVFEFDRNAGPDDKPHDYSCKKPECGAMFKTLAALGSHTRMAHGGGETPEDGADGETGGIQVAKDGRGKRKGGFTCKTPGCGVTVANLHELKVHKKIHKEAAVEQAA